MIPFNCTNCQAEFDVPMRSLGTIVACPDCGQQMQIPTKDNLPIESLRLIHSQTEKKKPIGTHLLWISVLAISIVAVWVVVAIKLIPVLFP